MNIHELTQQVYDVEMPYYWQEKHVNRLLATARCALSVEHPGKGNPVDVDEDTVRFVRLLHLLVEDCPNNGAVNRLTQPEIAMILVDAGAYGAPSGDLLVMKFVGGFHSAIVTTDKLFPAYINGNSPQASAWRIVRIP